MQKVNLADLPIKVFDTIIDMNDKQILNVAGSMAISFDKVPLDNL